MDSIDPNNHSSQRNTSHSLALYALIFGIVITGSRFHPKVQFVVRAIIGLLCTLFFSAYGSLIAIIFTFLGRRGEINWATARSFAYISAPLLGIRFKVEGEEYMNTRPAIFICNHQAAVDILVLGRIFPKFCSIVGKRSLKFVPLLGAYMQLGGAIFLDRGNHGDAVKTFAEAVSYIKERKVSVWIFPEGTRGHLKEADLLPFKKGAFHLAVQAGIPIVPIVVGNYSEIYDSKRQIFKGGEVHIKILPPISTEGIDQDDKEQIDELTNRTRKIMKESEVSNKRFIIPLFMILSSPNNRRQREISIKLYDKDFVILDWGIDELVKVAGL
ncbi:hypothetical protein G9A89_005909 [Geosiphon pyriformis]|nr:hypothetical protein G9A89_005909 [Geosiphon pyriformis]